MGLDITAVSKLRYAGKEELDGDEEWPDDLFIAFAYAGFEHSTRGLRGMTDTFQGGTFIGGHSYYATPDSEFHGFRAGSYGGYGEWRAGLATSTGHSLGDYFSGGDDTLPFYELIHFADNEGTIGPESARDLLEDFRTHRETYVATRRGSTWGQYDIERYDDWTRACELAADGGLVSFH